MILAAGRGERMGKLTLKTPKPLTKLGNMTLLEHNLKRIQNAEIDEVIINVSWLGDKIIKYLELLDLELSIKILNERENMLGTGGGVKNALSDLGPEPFYLINADVFSDYKIDITKRLKVNTLGHLIMVPNPAHHPEGDFNISEGLLMDSKGKCSHTFSGISLLSPELLGSCRDDVFALEAVLLKAARSRLLTGEEYNGLWIDVGAPERLRAAEQIVKQKRDIAAIFQ